MPPWAMRATTWSRTAECLATRNPGIGRRPADTDRQLIVGRPGPALHGGPAWRFAARAGRMPGHGLRRRAAAAGLPAGPGTAGRHPHLLAGAQPVPHLLAARPPG